MNPETNASAPPTEADSHVVFSCRQLNEVDPDDWNRLFASSDEANLFYDYAFVHAAAQAWPASQPLKVIVGYRGSNLVFLQVCRIEEGLLGKKVEFFAPPTADHIQPIVASASHFRILQDFRDYLVDTLRPDLLIATSLTEGFRAEISSGLRNSAVIHGDRKRGWFLDIPDSVEAFWARYRSNFRSQLRRQLRKAEAAELNFRIVTEEELPSGYDIQLAMDNLIRLHRLRFKALNKRSFFLQPDFKSFHQHLSQEASGGSCSTSFTEAIHDGKVVASIYGMRTRKTYLFLMIGFDPRYANFGPGGLLLYHTIDDLIRRGVKHFDFKCGDEPYKRRWASGSYEKADLQIILTAKGSLMRAWSKAAERVRRAPDRLFKRSGVLSERAAALLASTVDRLSSDRFEASSRAHGIGAPGHD